MPASALKLHAFLNYVAPFTLFLKEGPIQPPSHDEAFIRFCSRVTQVDLTPPWCLPFVLDALRKPPFNPIEKVTIQFVSWKICFLIALALGRCRTEIQALSIDPYLFHYGQEYSDVTFQHDPTFVAKTKILLLLLIKHSITLSKRPYVSVPPSPPKRPR